MTERGLRNGKFRKLFHGVYVHRETVLTEWTKAAGAILLCGGPAAGTHHTAARVWGGVVPEDGQVHVSTTGTRPKVLGIRAHRVAAGGQQCQKVDGLWVTTPTQTFLDLGAELGLVDLVVFGDSLVRAHLVTPEELVAAAATARGRGSRLARRAAGLVRRDVDSPMESRVRMLIVLACLSRR